MKKLSMMTASVCAIALCLGLSSFEVRAEDKEKAESGAGEVVQDAGKIASEVGGVTDALGITPSVFGYGAKEQVEAYTRMMSDTVDGVSGVLSGAGNSENFGKALNGVGIMQGDSTLAGLGSLTKNFKNINSLSDLTDLKNLGNVGMSFMKDMSPEIKQMMVKLHANALFPSV